MGNIITIPYSGRIPQGISIGADVVISGKVLHNCSRFSVNLCVGPNYDKDCALHFNPRLDDNKVVRNSRQNGAWGKEETAGGCPFRKGQEFEIQMKVQQHGYEVTVNHRHFCDFNHRMDKESIQYIYINGDVTIDYIQFRGGQFMFPVTWPPCETLSYPPTPGYPGAGSGPVYNPPVPFTSPIPGGLYPGKIIYISGVPNPNPSRFTVNLQGGPYDYGDFAMHFDVRFNYGSCCNQVVRTHKQGGNYGGEEKGISYFPFFPNTNFEMMILTEPSGFKIAVNNQHFVQFNHRLPFNCADHINIVGDVRLSQVRFQ